MSQPIFTAAYRLKTNSISGSNCNSTSSLSLNTLEETDDNDSYASHGIHNNNHHHHHHYQNYSRLFSLHVLLYLVVWYAVSSLTTQLTKNILDEFEFPVFVGEFQFFFNFCLGLFTIHLSKYYPSIKSWFPNSSFPQNSKFQFNRQMFKLFFPMGTFQFVGKLFSLAATSICTVATVSSIRALSPLFIVLGYRLHYRVVFSTKTYLSLLPLFVGVIIIVLSQTQDTSYNSISNYDKQLIENNSNQNSNGFIGSNLNNNNAQNLKQGLSSINEDPASGIVEDMDEDSSVFSALLAFVQNNHGNLQGIFYALLSSSVFAAGSIYAKNVISDNNNLSNNSALINTSTASNHNDDYNLNSVKEKRDITRLSLFSTDSTFNLNNIDLEKNSSSFNQKDNYSRHKVKRIDKLTTLMYCALYGLAYSIPTFLTYELPTLLSTKFYPSNSDLTPAVESVSIPYYTLIPWKLLILNGFSYFIQSLLAFHILGMLPTVTYSIANMMKRIVVIAVSMILRGKNLNIYEWLGLLHISLGLYIYEKWGSKQS